MEDTGCARHSQIYSVIKAPISPRLHCFPQGDSTRGSYAPFFKVTTLSLLSECCSQCLEMLWGHKCFNANDPNRSFLDARVVRFCLAHKVKQLETAAIDNREHWSGLSHSGLAQVAVNGHLIPGCRALRLGCLVPTGGNRICGQGQNNDLPSEPQRHGGGTRGRSIPSYQSNHQSVTGRLHRQHDDHLIICTYSLYSLPVCLCVCVLYPSGPVFAGVESEVRAGGGEEQSSDWGSADFGNWAPRPQAVPV